MDNNLNNGLILKRFVIHLRLAPGDSRTLPFAQTVGIAFFSLYRD